MVDIKHNVDSLIKVDDTTQFLLSNLDKIYNFDLKWTTMITNSPALFEDIEYIKVKNFIDDTVTDFEILQYREGNFNNLYPNLEYLLIGNLTKYDRIINFGTFIFYQYMKIGNSLINTNLDKVITEISMTATRFGMLALTSTKSTLAELEYAWNIKLKQPENKDVTPLEYNFKLLYEKSINFKLFIEYCSVRTQSKGFRNSWLNDVTSNSKLSQVCKKFTNKSNALDNSQLTEIYDYHTSVAKQHLILINSLRKSMDEMFHVDDEKNENEKYAVYVYNSEFYLHSVKFSMKVENNNSVISKEYIANSHECFIAEKYLISSMHEQINWTKYNLESDLYQPKQILKNLLYNMLKNDYRNIVCYKHMYVVNTGNVFSKITFSGIFANVYIVEELFLEGRIIKVNKVCKSKSNAAEIIINNGYTIFGESNDVETLLNNITNHPTQQLTREMMMDHYSKYCKPVMDHMFDVIQLYNQSKNDIINVLIGHLNPNNINNINIKSSKIKNNNLNPLKNINRKLLSNKKSKSYWKVIADE